MEIWHAAGESPGPALPEIVARAAGEGHVVTLHILSEATPPPGPLPLLWQEADDPLARATALRAGAGDVIGPWMHVEEALARLLRMAGGPEAGPTDIRLLLGELDIDLIGHSARRADRPLDLLRREYELLLYLARHCGCIQSREALLRGIWRLAFDPGTNVVQVHVSRLRAKLDRGFSRPMLRTVRGAGYCLEA